MRSIPLLFVLALAVAAPLGVLKPVDQAARDPSFLAFRNDLLTVVKKKDVPGLKAVVGEKIEYSFGAEEPGWKGFKQHYEPEVPTSELWPELYKVLTHGGSFGKDGGFQAPYYSSNWPENLDPYRHGAILGEHVNIRAEADPGSKVVTMLSYNLVEAVDVGPEFVKIKLPQGGTGYVSQQFFGHPVGYRAFFQKKGGAWKMTTFIAGD